MAFPPEFKGKYKNEADFTTNFLVPLFFRLGFSLVDDYHGASEFGKDLLFGEIDRLGTVRYYGLQAKYEASIGVNDVKGLITDAEHAFTSPFKHPRTQVQGRISGFYAVNGGSFSDDARVLFIDSLAKPYGGCVTLLDGKALIGLDRSVAIGRSEAMLARLLGLRLEIICNRALMNSSRLVLENRINQIDNKSLPSDRLRTSASSSYFECPFLSSAIPLEMIGRYCHATTQYNFFLNTLCQPLKSDHQRVVEAKLAIAFCSGIEEAGDKIAQAVESVLQALGPLVAV